MERERLTHWRCRCSRLFIPAFHWGWQGQSEKRHPPSQQGPRRGKTLQCREWLSHHFGDSSGIKRAGIHSNSWEKTKDMGGEQCSPFKEHCRSAFPIAMDCETKLRLCLHSHGNCFSSTVLWLVMQQITTLKPDGRLGLQNQKQKWFCVHELPTAFRYQSTWQSAQVVLLKRLQGLMPEYVQILWYIYPPKC